MEWCVGCLPVRCGGWVRRGKRRGMRIGEDQPEIVRDGFMVNDGVSCFPLLKLFKARALSSPIFVLWGLE